MTVAELLSDLQQKNVEIWVEGERLRYRGSDDVVTPALLTEIRKLKPDLIKILREKDARATPSDNGPAPAGSEPVKLEYRHIGNTGLKTSEFALGPYSSTMIMPGADGEFSRLLDIYVDAGGNHIDLSNVYTRSEERVGTWLKGKNRDQLIITSKVGMKAGDGPNDLGLSRKHILASIEQSLRSLGTDYVDIYYTHVWDAGTPLEETISALDRLVKTGKVRYLGLSNFTGWQVQKAVDLARFTGKERFTCLQTQYNLLDRYPEWEQIPVCRNEGLGITAWGSLSAGWLAGRYRRDMSPSDIGERPALEAQLGFTHNSFEFKNNERTWRTIDVLLEIAAEVNRSPAQVALNWLKERPGVVPILGARNVQQLKESLGAAGWSLSAKQRARLEFESQMPPIMPHMFIESVNSSDRR